MIYAYFASVLVTIGMCHHDVTNLSSECLAVTLGILRGLFIIGNIYIAFMWLYFKLRKRLQARYAAEAVVISLVVLLSVAGKMFISYFDSYNFVEIPRNAWDNTAKFLYAIYQSLGGVSFEGLADYELYESWRTMFYAGSSLVAGLVAVSILTFSISYGIYSYFAWLSFRGRRSAKIYIFTAVTEDSVTLAHSIDEENKKRRNQHRFAKILNEEKQISQLSHWRSFLTGGAFLRAVYRRWFKKPKHIIVFLRTEDEGGFDSRNALHIDIMHSGFLFMSYNPGKKEKSIAKFLKINVRNDYCIVKEKNKQNEKESEEEIEKENKKEKSKNLKYRIKAIRGSLAEIHIFALDWEKGKTSENDNLVFADILRVAKETFDYSETYLKKLYYKYKLKRDISAVEKAVTDKKKIAGLIRKRVNDRIEDEINRRTEKNICKLKRIVNYHYLVSEEIDLSNVDMRFDKEMAKFSTVQPEKSTCSDEYGKPLYMSKFGNHAKKKLQCPGIDYDQDYIRFKRHFWLHTLNEANMAAMLYIKERAKVTAEFPDVYKEDVKGDQYKAMFIGFGQNGQQTLKAAYIFAAAGKFSVEYNNKKYKVSSSQKKWVTPLRNMRLADYEAQPFVADVYDKNADDLGGLFKMRHPAFDVMLPGCSEDCSSDGCDCSLGGFYKVRKQSTGKENGRKKAERYLYSYAPVKVRMFKESAYSDNILKKLDKNLGEDKSTYNLIAIALGDDDSNVSIANALLEDYKHEFEPVGWKKSRKTQIFAINLRDRQNYDRINWCEKDKAEYPNLKVVIYGAAEDMYSYENIVDQSTAMRWNSGYCSLQENGKDYGELLDRDLTKILTSKADVRIKKYMGIMYSYAQDSVNIEKDWSMAGNITMYSRTSSRYASEFGPFIAEYCKIITQSDDTDFRDVSLETVVRLGAVEHDRWIRFVLTNGYVRGNVKDRYVKMHSDIIPYDELECQTNDMTNVFNALTHKYIKECEEKGEEAELEIPTPENDESMREIKKEHEMKKAMQKENMENPKQKCEDETAQTETTENINI